MAEHSRIVKYVARYDVTKLAHEVHENDYMAGTDCDKITLNAFRLRACARGLDMVSTLKPDALELTKSYILSLVCKALMIPFHESQALPDVESLL